LQSSENKVLHTDKSRIQTLLRNLIGNAVKYRKEREGVSSFVEFRIFKDNEHFVLEVEDNGEGIAEKNKDKIFDMFFRASKTSTGTGLGLYICKQIIDKLNGKLELISSQQSGSVFQIRLPLYEQER
jgi:signal transduction histidine kinase